MDNTTIICSSCGAELAEGKKFCSNCGAVVAAASEIRAEAEPVSEDVPEVIDNSGLCAEMPDPAPEELTHEQKEPVAEIKKESRKERRQKEKSAEKAAKEAEKQQAKEEKKQAKEEARRQRRENFRKRNIWAIILMVLFFAGLCWLGYEYIGARTTIKNLEADKAALTENVESLEQTRDENEEAIAAGKSELEAQLEKQTELEGKNAELNEELEQVKEDLEDSKDEIKDLKKDYEKLLSACSQDNLGYASENFYADHSVVIMEEGKTAEIKVYAAKIKSIDCENDNLTVEQGSTEDNCTSVSLQAEKAGVYLVTISNGKDTLSIIVIQK